MSSLTIEIIGGFFMFKNKVTKSNKLNYTCEILLFNLCERLEWHHFFHCLRCWVVY